MKGAPCRQSEQIIHPRGVTGERGRGRGAVDCAERERMEDGFSSYSSLYDTSSLLQFCNDDSASAASSMEVTDRIASLEQRVQMQEDEIQLLKSALADVVRRLNVSEEQQAVGSRKGPTKARPMIATLPLRPTVNNGTILPKKGSNTLPSPSGSGSRKDTNKSTVRRVNSNEHVGTLTRKDSGDSKGNRARAGSTGSNSSGKKADSKQRDPVFNAGMRRVTHCKVTLQLYLGHGKQTTMSSGLAASAAAARSASDPQCFSKRNSVVKKANAAKVTPVRKAQHCSLQLRSSGRMSSPLDVPSYRSPVKSPSQYFQICY